VRGKPKTLRLAAWPVCLTALVLGVGACAAHAERSALPPVGPGQLSGEAALPSGPPFVYVSPDEVLLMDEVVATSAARKAGTRRPGLRDGLQRHRRRVARFTGEVFVCAHGAATFGVVREVLNDCRAAGYSKLSIGLLRRTAQKESLPGRSSCTAVKVSQRQRPPARTGGIMIFLLVSGDSYTLSAKNERLKLGDRDDLRQRLRDLRRRRPELTELTVTAKKGVAHARLMVALATARGAGFKAVSLSTTGELPKPKITRKGLIMTRGMGSAYGVGGYATLRPGGSAKHRAIPAHRRRPRKFSVRGGLSAKIIRRIVKRHKNEVRYCYVKELSSSPGLKGKVVINFIISGKGRVVMSRVQASTLRNRAVEICVKRAVRRWLFPRPRGGGIVIVDYPFVLR